MTIIQSIARTISVTGVSALFLTAIIISPARAEALLTGRMYRMPQGVPPIGLRGHRRLRSGLR